MTWGDPRAVVLMGAQRFDPNLIEAVTELRVEGRIAAITAGWQEREEEDDDLAEHLGDRTVNLRLHARAEEVFKQDPDLAALHRERQAVLRHRQDFYRVRLEHALEAQYVIDQRHAPDDILEDEARTSILAIQEIDRMHLEQCARDHAEFEREAQPDKREVLLRHREEIAAILSDCDAIAIAGGHVATLLNRLRLFKIETLARGKVVFAWCGGAMVVCDRVVLFHHAPPQGPGAAEVLDAGLGLAPGIVALPQPELRLRFDDEERLMVMARRFAPAKCLVLPARSRVAWLRDGPTISHGASVLELDGAHRPFVSSGLAR